ncbi:E3 ubiquitin-protein ligase Bre1-like [Octopus sinensis]|uniref:E3 ubiquitin-protein ligase Bre1-like n=1 Tax=Octopus sinensis TaxID=2607531 RepID=A0A6P7TUX8_9MOLL|nr:E3 ubiquitin-protein ligase Bre1-like [Octopus sinensis]
METEELEKEFQRRVEYSNTLMLILHQVFEGFPIYIKDHRLVTKLDKLTTFYNTLKESPDSAIQENLKLLSADLVTQLTNENLNETDDNLTIEINSAAENKRKLDELNYEFAMLEKYSIKLEESLKQSQQDISKISTETKDINPPQEPTNPQLSTEDMTELQQLRLEEHNLRHLNDSRLQELETMQKEIDRLTVLVESGNERVDYPDLSVELSSVKRQLSTCISDLARVKARLTESNELNYILKVAIQQIKDDLKIGKEISESQKVEDIIRLTEQLAGKEKELELVKLENEQYALIKEHTNDVHREMRHLINSLQAFNKQLKNKNNKYHIKLNETLRNNEVSY